MAESASAGAPDVGDAARSADAADAADSATAAGGTDSAPASAPPSAVSRQLFSDKQCEVVRGWLVDFNRAFEGGDIVKNAAAERAGAGHRRSRRWGRGGLAVSVDDGRDTNSSVVTVVASILSRRGLERGGQRERRLRRLLDVVYHNKLPHYIFLTRFATRAHTPVAPQRTTRQTKTLGQRGHAHGTGRIPHTDDGLNVRET